MTAARISRLSNGIPVVTESLPGISSIAIRAFIAIGSRHEMASNSGIAHLLEHLAFKGTTTRTARDIALSVERVGANINAETGTEKTSYDVHALSEQTQLGIDILADVIGNSTIPAGELDNERNVIVQEIIASLDDPEDLVDQKFDAIAFPRQAIGRSTLGDASFIKAVQRDEVLEFMRRTYAPKNIILVAAGKVEHEAFCAMAERAFGSLVNYTETAVTAIRMQPARYVGGYKFTVGSSEQTHVKLGFPVCARNEPLYHATILLADVLGGGMSSPLVQEVRETRGLAYDVMATSRHYNDIGTFQIYAALADEHLPEFIKVTCDELRKVCSTITAEDFERAKNQYRAAILMQRERPYSVAGSLARDMINYGRIQTVEEVLAAAEAVTMADMQQVARRMLTYTPTLTIVGPREDDDYDAFSDVCTRLAGLR